MENNFHKTPDTSRGVVNTMENEFFVDLKEKTPIFQRLVIDWFQFTIKDEDFNSIDELKIDVYEFYTKNIYKKYLSPRQAMAIYLFKYFFGVEEEKLISELRGINGYSYCISYKNIEIYYSDRSDMGFNIKMSGQACRDFEELELNWNDFFKKINEFMFVNVNRIDLAIDDFTNDYFDLNKIKKYFRKGLVTAKSLKYYGVEERYISDNTYKGNSLQIGSKASNCQITFYDKLLERQNNNYVVANNIKFWTRTELRFRHDYAKNLMSVLSVDVEKLSNIILGVLNEYITFREFSPTDSNKSRWPVAKWWSKFIGNVEKLKLTTCSYDQSITKSKKWIREDTSKSQLKVMIADLDDLDSDDVSLDFIKSCLIDVSKKLTKKDIETINSYRLANNKTLVTLDEVNAYIRDIKDILLIKKQDN